MGGRKGIWPVKTEWCGAGVVICLERRADLHMAQLMPLPLTVSCFSKVQTGLTFLVQAHPGCPGTHTHTHNRLTAVDPRLPGRAGTRRNTHSHPSWSSDILYQLSPFTTIHSILCVQFTCLTVLFDSLSPGPLWSSSWSCLGPFTLYSCLLYTSPSPRD